MVEPTGSIWSRTPTFLTLDRVWALLALTVPFIAAAASRMATIDLAYQVRLGDLMIDAHHLVRTDTFTFTAAGRAWLDQQWGAQVLFAEAWRGGGWATVAVLRAALTG